MTKIAILQNRRLDSPIFGFQPSVLQILFVTLTTLSQTPSHPSLSAHTCPKTAVPPGTPTKIIHFPSDSAGETSSCPTTKKRNAGSPAFPTSTLSWRNLLIRNDHEAVPSEGQIPQRFFASRKKESDENLMWNPHRFHWLRSIFNSVSSKAARTSCVGFHLRHRHLSGVHPLFHQLRDQQTDLTDDDHTRQQNWHQNTCVQHCTLSLLIYPLVCSLRRITAASHFWNLLSISCKSQQITYSVLHRHTHPCFCSFLQIHAAIFQHFYGLSALFNWLW